MEGRWSNTIDNKLCITTSPANANFRKWHYRLVTQLYFHFFICHCDLKTLIQSNIVYQRQWSHIRNGLIMQDMGLNKSNCKITIQHLWFIPYSKHELPGLLCGGAISEYPSSSSAILVVRRSKLLSNAVVLVTKGSELLRPWPGLCEPTTDGSEPRLVGNLRSLLAGERTAGAEPRRFSEASRGGMWTYLQTKFVDIHLRIGFWVRQRDLQHLTHAYVLLSLQHPKHSPAMISKPTVTFLEVPTYTSWWVVMQIVTVLTISTWSIHKVPGSTVNRATVKLL